MGLRIAFSGASGTGKTTLASHLAEALGIPLCPVGPRQVAAQMGYASPYDVDGAGRRAEFQRRLLDEKVAWEAAHASFVTDRSAIDLLAYFALHDVRSVTAEVFDRSTAALRRYTHVLYCPVAAHCAPAGDPQRVQEVEYHRICDAILSGLIGSYMPEPTAVTFGALHMGDLAERRRYLEVLLSPAVREERHRAATEPLDIVATCVDCLGSREAPPRYACAEPAGHWAHRVP
jgi:predicted ATPase